MCVSWVRFYSAGWARACWLLARGVSSLFNKVKVKKLLKVLLYVKRLNKGKRGYSSYWMHFMVMTGFRNKGREEAI